MKDGKSIVIFIAVFFFCWLPYSTCIIFISLCNSCWALIPEDEAFYFLLICGYLNSALNPILFAIWNRSFKATYSRLLSLALSKSHPSKRWDGEVSEFPEIPDSPYSHIHLQRIRLASATETEEARLIAGIW